MAEISREPENFGTKEDDVGRGPRRGNKFEERKKHTHVRELD